MSPEQLKSSRDVDHRSDIWSLGVILFELVTGKRPFTATSITELAIRVAVDPRPPLPTGVPHGFDHVIDRCLAKEPTGRYVDLAHLAQALAPFAGPDGADLASAVARMLRVSPIGLLDGPTEITGAISPDVPPTVLPTGYAAPVPAGYAVPATVLPTGYATPALTPPPHVAAVMSVATPPPATTLGASAISREAPAAPPPRRWSLARHAPVRRRDRRGDPVTRVLRGQ
jgi:serine/threonine-protein kinase